MAVGALAHSRASVAVAVTGIAGPGGATPGKPVGTVWIAVASARQPAVATLLLAPGDRAGVREASVVRALSLLVARCLAS
jgi:nicotinamide-nucleotide amidase